MNEMISEMKTLYVNFNYFYLFFASILIALIFAKGNRKSFLVPSVLLAALILNPLFYSFWNKIAGYAYFRAVWMIPIIPVCAMLPSVFIDRIDKKVIQVGIAVATVAVFVLLGTYIYQYDNTSFVPAENAEKLPDDAVRVADALLKIDDDLTVVSDGPVCIYLRQCSGKIRMPYSREVSFGALTPAITELYSWLSQGDMGKVSSYMIENGYKYLVAQNDNEVRRAAIEGEGFVLVDQVNQYGIYRLNEQLQIRFITKRRVFPNKSNNDK